LKGMQSEIISQSYVDNQQINQQSKIRISYFDNRQINQQSAITNQNFFHA
jgi:hypothetical protein